MNALEQTTMEFVTEVCKKSLGISKRDVAAMVAMNALVSKYGCERSPEEIAIDSYTMADVLIKEGENERK